jgi:hypothetical protein
MAEPPARIFSPASGQSLQKRDDAAKAGYNGVRKKNFEEARQ